MMLPQISVAVGLPDQSRLLDEKSFIERRRHRARQHHSRHARRGDRSACAGRRADPRSGSRARHDPPCPRAHRAAKDLYHKLAALVREVSPQLLAEPGIGVLLAAKFIGEIAGIDRFTTDALNLHFKQVAVTTLHDNKGQNRFRVVRRQRRPRAAAAERTQTAAATNLQAAPPPVADRRWLLLCSHQHLERQSRRDAPVGC
jgi:hypothetical protein